MYHLGKRTKEWIKFKRMADEDFVICGYQPGDMIKLILGEYDEGELVYAGTVTLGVRRDIVEVLREDRCPFRMPPKGKEQVVWCRPERVCTVEYMPNTKDALRQAVFKGIRNEL